MVDNSTNVPGSQPEPQRSSNDYELVGGRWKLKQAPEPTPGPTKKAKKAVSKEDRKDGEVFSSYFEHEESLYLDVRKDNGGYAFAYLDSSNSVRLIPEVTIRRLKIMPRELPQVAGQVLEIAGLPSEGITKSKLLSPEEIQQKVKRHIAKYVDLGELDLDLACWYVLFTWFYPKVDTLGYLRFIADTGKGKSRAKRVVGDLCFYPLYASGASSFSGMARTQERWRGTLVVDEADFTGEKENQIMKYLNLGFERGQFYFLSDKKNPRHQDYFDPFAPKVLAMREPFHDNATEARLLSISMHETGSPHIPIIIPPDYVKEMKQVRDELALFALNHWGQVDGTKMLSFNDFKIEPRLKQLAMPLCIILQIWSEGIGHFRQYLLKRQVEIRKTRALSWEGSLFNLVYAIATGDFELGEEFAPYYETQTGKIQAVTPTMVSRRLRTSAKEVTRGLIRIGFQIEWRWIYFHKEDNEVRRRVRAYCVPDLRVWNEAVSRYYYSEESDNQYIAIPGVLKSSKFGVLGTVPSVPSVPKKDEDGSPGEFGTDGTDGTLPHTPDNNLQSEQLKPDPRAELLRLGELLNYPKMQYQPFKFVHQNEWGWRSFVEVALLPDIEEALAHAQKIA